jgi:sec-independent protein translocase protein TatC
MFANGLACCMASALDEDTRRTIDAGRETAGAMLRAAQKDLQKVFVVFLVGFLGTFYALRLYVWDFLEGVTRAQMGQQVNDATSIIAQTPFDVILLQAKIGMVAGLIIAVPPFLYFSRDALKERGIWPSAPVATWKVAVLVALIVGLFVAGVLYGYLVFFPFVFSFLAGNAVSSQFTPTYSIVKWAEFIFLLTISFGLAAQMPLAVTGLSYTEIVPYETFRDKWRYAVVGIFVFGALFSPPDPFTQIMWAVPLLVLYGASLYLAKLVVTAKRGSEGVDLPAVARANWNLLAGAGGLGVAAVYFFYFRGGVEAVNGILAGIDATDAQLAPAGSVLPLPPAAAVAVWGAVAGGALVVVALAYLVFQEISASAPAPAPGEFGDPTAIDVAALDADGVRSAPVEAFADMTEEEAVDIAGAAIDAGDKEKARAVMDRFDEAQERTDADATASGAGGDGGGGRARRGPAGTWREPVSGPLSALSVGTGRVDWERRARTHWNLPLFVGALAFAAVYVAYGTPLVPPELADALPSLSPVAPLAEAAGLGTDGPMYVAGAAAGVVGFLAAIAGYALLAAYRAGTDPAAVDLSVLDADEIETAPRALFVGLTETDATREADRSLAAGADRRARAILDRYDDAQRAPDEREQDPSELEERATRAGGALAEGLTDGDTDEDDIGGYYDDVAFIVDSVTSKSFRILAVFATTLAVVFAWLYTGGIGRVRADFLARLPEEVVPTDFNVVALHPVEVLIFEVKFSTLVAVLVVLPMIAYYAWPALRERSFVRGRRQVIFGWTLALLVGLFAGSYIGYTFVAPSVISWLVADAVNANMIIAYRITNFFWLIFFTTAGIGLLADIPVLMVLLNTAGVSYRTIRGRWREVTVAILAVAALFTPASISTMFLVTVPLMAAYGLGIAALFVLTLGGRRDLAPGRTSEV